MASRVRESTVFAEAFDVVKNQSGEEVKVEKRSEQTRREDTRACSNILASNRLMSDPVQVLQVIKRKGRDLQPPKSELASIAPLADLQKDPAYKVRRDSIERSCVESVYVLDDDANAKLVKRSEVVNGF